MTDGDSSDTDRKAEASRTGATWIEEDDTVAFGDLRPVRVAGDDEVEAAARQALSEARRTASAIDDREPPDEVREALEALGYVE